MNNRLKEFWEWCEITEHEIEYKDFVKNETIKRIEYKYPDKIQRPFLPELTLDNLFKYAVPNLPHVNKEVVSISFIPTYDNKFACTIRHFDEKIGGASDEKPEIALYEALKQILL